MGLMVNNIWLAWKMGYMLKTYRICNPQCDFQNMNSITSY